MFDCANLTASPLHVRLVELFNSKRRYSSGLHPSRQVIVAIQLVIVTFVCNISNHRLLSSKAGFSNPAATALRNSSRFSICCLPPNLIMKKLIKFYIEYIICEQRKQYKYRHFLSHIAMAIGSSLINWKSILYKGHPFLARHSRYEIWTNGKTD